jgi:hypothetical protein
MLKKALDRFGSDVVKRSKSELSKKGKNASKSLSKSLDYNVKISKNSFELSFVMEDYGKFIDKGVKGVGGTKADGSSWKKKKVTNSLYKYKSKRPPAKAFNNWTVRKGIAPRNQKGQFTTRKSLMFAIAESVYRTGLETTNFFTKPFEKEFKQLPEDLVEAYGLEVDEFLKFTIQ